MDGYDRTVRHHGMRRSRKGVSGVHQQAHHVRPCRRADDAQVDDGMEEEIPRLRVDKRSGHEQIQSKEEEQKDRCLRGVFIVAGEGTAGLEYWRERGRLAGLEKRGKHGGAMLKRC